MDAANWLNRRGSTAPAALDDRIRAAVGGRAATSPSADPAPRGLAEAALDRLEAVLRSPNTRAAAVDLLAADALLTFACEAAAERGPAALAALVDAYDPARFAELIPPASDGASPGTEDR